MHFITLIFFDPFLNLFTLLLKVLGGNMGLAIISLTALFRVIVLPLNWKSLHSQRKMQQLKPHLDKLKETHKEDKGAFAQAQMELFKQHGVSPIGGCLPMLLQLPFLFGVYAAMRFVVDLRDISQLNTKLYFDWLHISRLSEIHLQFLWIPNLAHADPIYILPVLAGITQFFLSRMMMPPKVEAAPAGAKKEASLEQSMASAQRQMVYFFPIMTFLVALRFPSGLALYWTVGNLFSLIQQFYVNRALPHPVSEGELLIEGVSEEVTEVEKAISKAVKRNKKKKKK